MSYYVDGPLTMERSQRPLRPLQAFIVCVILFGSFFAAFAREETSLRTSAMDAIPQSDSIFDHNTANSSQRSLGQNAFQICNTKQTGIFPSTAANWLPGCQTATGAVFDGLKQLTNLIPSEDDTVKDVIEHVLAPVQLIVETIADFAGIGASICLGNFPGKTIVDPNDDDNMIGMCESIPVEKSEDAEWSLFGMSVNIPSALGAILCPAVDVETFEVCFAISLCGSLPSIAFGMNGDILGCIASQPQFAASTLGASTLLAHAVEKGLQSLGSGFSLTNAFEIPLIIYNGHERFDYSARPTLMDFVEIGISGEEIHKKLKDWIEISVKFTRGISIFGPTKDTVESALTSYDAKEAKGDVTNVFSGWTVQAFAKGEVTMTVSFQNIPKIGDILPELEDISLGDTQAMISTGTQNIVDDSGKTTTIYPGIYLYQGTTAAATAITSIVSTVLKSVWTIIDLMPDWLPIEITADDIIAKLGLSSDDIDDNDSMGVGITVNTNRAGIFFGMPVLIDALGTISINCYTDYESFNCKASYNGNIDKYFTAAVEFITDGAVWLAKEADKLFNDVGNVLATAIQDVGGTIKEVFSKDNLKKTAKDILSGAINLAGLVGIDSEAAKAVAAFMESTFSPEALLDNLGDMVQMVGNVGKQLIDDAENAYKAAEKTATDTYNAVRSYGSRAINWLENELGKVADDVSRAVVQAYNDLKREVSGFIDDVGKFLESGINDVVKGVENLWNSSCRDKQNWHGYINEWDTAHTNCRFKAYRIQSRPKNHVPCCWGCNRSWHTHSEKKYLDESCVREHLEKVKIEKQAKKDKEKALSLKSKTAGENKDAKIALSYSSSNMTCKPSWIRSRKNGKSIPFSVTCTVDTISKQGQKGRETVTKERLIDLSATLSKTKAMNELIDITKDTLTAKITRTMNGGFLGCFVDNLTTCVEKSTHCPSWASRGECEKNPNYMLHNCKKSCGTCEVHVGKFDKNPTKCVQECRNKGFKYASTTTSWDCRCTNIDYKRYEEAAGCQCGTKGNGGGTHNNKRLQCVYQSYGRTINVAKGKSTSQSSNVAKGKSTSQTSTGWSGLSARAVDGNTDGNYGGSSVSHTNLEDKPWWAVDLAGYYLIDHIKVYNRKDCCSDRLDNFDVIITNNGKEVWKYQQTGKALEVTDIDVPANIQGNKVQVQLRGKNYLQLAEVEVFGVTKLLNVAKGKSTSQTSTGWSGLSARAVDGNTDGNYGGSSVSHTNLEDKPWWAVDLAGYYLIDHIKVYNRKDCCSDRLDNFDVIITNDGKEVWKYQQTGKALEVTDIHVPANIQGNKVKVQLRGKNYLQLAEVEVFGMKGKTS